MPGMIEGTQVGERRDLSDYIVNIQREDTPLFTMLPKDTCRATTVETQADDYGNTDDISGVGSGEDATDFDNMAEGRGVITNQVMKMWEKPMVDDFAENVNENDALPEGEYTDAVRKGTVRLKFRIEKQLLSQVEGQRQQAGKKYQSCAIGGFLKPTAPTGTQTIPAQFMIPAAQVFTGTLATFTEDVIIKMLQEIFESTNGMGEFTGVVGSELKRIISLFQIYRPDVAGSTNMRKIEQAQATKIETKVDILSGDFGTVTLVPSTRVRYFDGAGAATSLAQRRGSGYILDLTRWGLAFKRKPGHKPQADKGGGPRGIIDTIFSLRCKAPKCNGAVLI